MQYVQGHNLSEELYAGPLGAKQAAELMVNICKAVHYAHTQGIIHRDLKPSNILLDEQGVPLVSDFGLAKRLDAGNELTMSGQVIGTPQYMPPEQALAKRELIGELSDVYSLGATFYAVLTGRAPFQAASATEILERVIHDDPLPVSQLNKSVPKDLETICMKALAKKPKDRFQSVNEMAEEIARYLRREPIRSRPVGRLSLIAKWCVRHPARAVIIGALALISASGTGAAIYFNQLYRKVTESEQMMNDARQLAESERNKAVESKNLLQQTYLRELEAKAELVRAKDEADSLNGELLAEAGRQDMVRGEWQAALTHFEAAARYKLKDPIGVMLDRITAIFNKGDAALSLSELETLMPQAVGTSHEARAKLLHGDVLIATSQHSKAYKLIGEALAIANSNLSIDDRCYGQALIADSPAEAEVLLDNCLKANPFHYRALGQLTLLSFLSGKRERTRAAIQNGQSKYPADKSYKIVEALLVAAEGDMPTALRMVEPVRELVPPDNYKALVSTLEIYYSWSDAMDHWDSGFNAESFSSLSSMYSVFGKVENSLSRNVDHAAAAHSPVLLRMPPSVTRLQHSLSAATLHMYFGQYHDAAKHLDQVLKKTDQGELYFLLGELQIAMLALKGEDPVQRFVLAEQAFANAARSPSLWMNVDREAHYAAAMAAGGAMVYEQKAGGGGREHLERALQHAWRRVEFGNLRPPHDTYLYNMSFKSGHDLILARRIVDDVLNQNPSDIEWRRRLIDVAIAQKHFSEAIQLCNELLNDHPSDELLTRQKLTALEGMEDLYLKGGSPGTREDNPQ